MCRNKLTCICESRSRFFNDFLCSPSGDTVDVAKGCCEEVVWGGTSNPVPEIRDCLQPNNILYAKTYLVSLDVCVMLYAKNIRISFLIQLHCAVCKPACFSGYSDTESSAQWRICHIHHVMQI